MKPHPYINPFQSAFSVCVLNTWWSSRQLERNVVKLILALCAAGIRELLKWLSPAWFLPKKLLLFLLFLLPPHGVKLPPSVPTETLKPGCYWWNVSSRTALLQSNNENDTSYRDINVKISHCGDRQTYTCDCTCLNQVIFCVKHVCVCVCVCVCV